MKVGILAGGLGSRLAEETVIKPKPMVEVGGRPILWHIMKHYSTYGFKEFVVALGYKGEYIKRYMTEYCALAPDLRVFLKSGQIAPHANGNGEGDPRGLGSRSHRHRPVDQHRRPYQTPQALHGQLHLHAHLGRRRLEHQPRRAAQIPS